MHNVHLIEISLVMVAEWQPCGKGCSLSQSYFCFVLCLFAILIFRGQADYDYDKVIAYLLHVKAFRE